MSLRALHKNRGVGAVIALIGMAFYAMLFPWHTVSQTSLLLAQAALAQPQFRVATVRLPASRQSPPSQ